MPGPSNAPFHAPDQPSTNQPSAPQPHFQSPNDSLRPQTPPADSSQYLQDRRYRTAFSKSQLDILEKEFSKDSYVNKSRRKELAQSLKLAESTVKVI